MANEAYALPTIWTHANQLYCEGARHGAEATGGVQHIRIACNILPTWMDVRDYQWLEEAPARDEALPRRRSEGLVLASGLKHLLS